VEKPDDTPASEETTEQTDIKQDSEKPVDTTEGEKDE
jgi:hypothetical protein